MMREEGRGKEIKRNGCRKKRKTLVMKRRGEWCFGKNGF